MRSGSIKTVHVPSRDMLADLLTKPPTNATFVPLKQRIYVEPTQKCPPVDDVTDFNPLCKQEVCHYACIARARI